MADQDLVKMAERAGLLQPMAIRTAATLRLADLIEAGATTVPELAELAGVDPIGLRALLRFLCTDGLFDELSPGVFGLNDRSRVLLDEHPSGTRQWLDLEYGIGSRMELAFVDMLDALRTGRPAFEIRYGRPYWDDIGADPSRSTAMHQVMAQRSEDQYRRIRAFIQAYDWNGVEHVVDVGGGDGGVLLEVLRAVPNAKGTLLEPPDRLAGLNTVQRDRELWARCTVVGGSFFDPLPSGADVYLLAGILGGWDDAAATAILRRCREAAGPNGRIALPEAVPADRSEPGTGVSDLLIRLVLGGYQRIQPELAEIAKAAGLQVREFAPDFAELVAAESS